MNVSAVVDARKLAEGGQVLKIDQPPTGPVTAVWVQHGTDGFILIAFDRSILRIERASKEDAKSFAPDPTEKLAAYFIGTGLWHGPEPFTGNDVEPAPTLAAALIGCKLIEVRAFGQGVSIDFGDHILLLTAGKITLASINGPTEDTATKC